MFSRFSRWMPKLGYVAVTVALLLLLLQPVTTAQSNNFDARISRLESEYSALRSRVNQLSSEVSRLGRATGTAVNLPAPEPQTSSDATALSNDPMFRRLSTLVIELRERIVALETQMAAMRSHPQ